MSTDVAGCRFVTTHAARAHLAALRQQLRQPLARVKHPRLDSAGWDVEEPRHLMDGLLSIVHQVDYVAVSGRQILHGLKQD